MLCNCDLIEVFCRPPGECYACLPSDLCCSSCEARLRKSQVQRINEPVSYRECDRCETLLCLRHYPIDDDDADDGMCAPCGREMDEEIEVY
jgi:hypothetical protein